MDLADRFVGEVLLAYERIGRMPGSGHPYLEDTRRVLLPSFPYEVVYRTLTDKSVEVIAIAHTSRRQGYWLERD
jgi:plasmid stabilization system protein ParE